MGSGCVRDYLIPGELNGRDGGSVSERRVW